MAANLEGDDVTESPASPHTEPYEVGVAIVAAGQASDDDNGRRDALPGYDDSWGRTAHQPDGTRRVVLVEKGDQAVRAATEAIANQISLAAQRIATTIEKQDWSAPGPDTFGLESVQIAFGVTLTAGIQTIFTAQAESSAQVTITLSRLPTAK